MFQKKVLKSEEPDKAPFTCYYPHTININQRVWNQGYMDWISIDPAVKKNLALRVERRHNNGHIESIVFAKCEFKEVVVMGGVSVDKSFDNITTFLDKFKPLYMTCHIFIFERQMPINYKSNRVAQHVMSYFMTLLKDSVHLPWFFEISATIKTKWLNAPANLNDTTRKTWGSKEAYKFLEWRNDSFGMQVMRDNWEKQDDLADTVIQIEAVCRMLGYPATLEPVQPIAEVPTSYPQVPQVAIPSFTVNAPAPSLSLNFNSAGSPPFSNPAFSFTTPTAVTPPMLTFDVDAGIVVPASTHLLPTISTVTYPSANPQAAVIQPQFTWY